MVEQPSVEPDSFSRQELEQLAGEKLPPRTALSLVNAKLAANVDAAVAANLLADEALPESDPD